MNKQLLFTLATIITFLASCASNEETTIEKSNTLPGLNCTATPIEEADEGSRSSLSLGPAGMQFSWEEGDKLTVFYADADQQYVVYSLNKIDEQNNHSANFKSEGFQLTPDKRYYAISTTESLFPEGISTPDKRNIVLKYSGQIQKGNRNTNHLGKYDYMAASGIAEDDHVNLHFLHLGLTLRVIMDGLPDDVEFKRMEMYDTEHSFLQPVRSLDLTSGLADDGTYTPSLKPTDINSTEYKAASRFSLELQDDTNNSHGIKPGSNGVASGRLEMYMEVPPVDLTGKDIVFVVEGNNGKSYYIKCTGRNLVAGKAYQMMGTASAADNYNVKIKVNHAWQNGSTLDSRAGTGDPGNEEKFNSPKNIYYILCVDNKVKAVNENAYTTIVTNPETDWTRSADNTTSTYKETINLSFAEDEKGEDHTRNLYLVASNNDLSSLFSGVTAGATTESDIRNIVYSIDRENLGEGYTDQQKSQAFMKNLYSTPWTEEDFVGSLGTDKFKDITLYHVAAKVDIMWNSAKPIIYTDSEHPENNLNYVSINNVQSRNLSLFQPAMVNGTAFFVKDADDPAYTVSSIIEADRMYNGRQIFYLPQFSSSTPNVSRYNVTIGYKKENETNIANTMNVDFKPITTTGFTSWLRWLKSF